MQIEIHKIEVRGLKVSVINIPIAASVVQFVLTNNIGEIMSVGFLDFGGEVTWKFGRPSKEFLTAIEEELRKLFECGENWEG